MDGLGAIIFIAAAGVGIVVDDWGGSHKIYCLTRGYIAFSRGDRQVYGSGRGGLGGDEVPGLKTGPGEKGGRY